QQAVDGEAAGAVQGDVAGNVALRDGRAHVGTLHRALLGDEAHGGHAEAAVGRGQANGDSGAAAPGGGVGDGKHALAAGGFDDVIVADGSILSHQCGDVYITRATAMAVYQLP